MARYVVEFTTDVDYTDPALDYLSTGWEMMYVTACKLYNFPDKEAPAGSQLQPEVAAGLPVVSNGGKTYTIKLKSTYKFSDGSKVTAASFVDAFNRNANPKLQSPSTPFMDVIAGLQAVVDGKATKISGVSAPNATTLEINLTKAAPDLVSRLTMPFFQAIPKSLAANADPNGVLTYAGCGPYYFSARTPNKSITLKRNPNYKGPRPANVDTIQVNVGNSLDVIQQNVESGKADYAAGGIPPTAWAHARSEVRRQQGPRLREAAARHVVPRDEPRSSAVQEQPAAREGGQLGDRPSGDPEPGRLPLR